MCFVFGSAQVQPLRGLAHYSPEFASQLWVAIFPIAWGRLEGSDQRALSQQLKTLLAREWQYKQRKSPNIIQPLLQALGKCHPPPTDIPPNVLKYLAKQHNAWHQAATILEKSIHGQPHDLMSQSSEERTGVLAAYRALGEIYVLLDEKDVMYGLWQRRVQSNYSRAALSLQQYVVSELCSAIFALNY